MSSPPEGVRFRAWNLLLLVPLIVLVTPLFNSDSPRLGGMPFFYWFQLAIIPVGVVCTVTVHLVTRSRDEEAEAGPDPDPDTLDSAAGEGAR